MRKIHNEYLTCGLLPGGTRDLPRPAHEKVHWLTVALEAGVEDEKIKFLVDMSYELTK